MSSAISVSQRVTFDVRVLSKDVQHLLRPCSLKRLVHDRLFDPSGVMRIQSRDLGERWLSRPFHAACLTVQCAALEVIDLLWIKMVP